MFIYTETPPPRLKVFAVSLTVSKPTFIHLKMTKEKLVFTKSRTTELRHTGAPLVISILPGAHYPWKKLFLKRHPASHFPPTRIRFFMTREPVALLGYNT